MRQIFTPAHGEIHVQTDALWKSLDQHAVHDFLHMVAHGLEIGIGQMRAERKSNRGNVFHTAFKGHAHRARIVVVDGGIVAVVDAAEHEVGHTLAEAELVDGELHAIHGRSAARPHFYVVAHVVAAAQRERVGGREGAAVARARTFGSTHEHVGERSDEINEGTNASSLESVVVGNQDERARFRSPLHGVCRFVHTIKILILTAKVRKKV